MGRVSIQVELPSGVALKLRTICNDRNRIQKAMASRVLEWWVSRPAPVRTVVISDVDEGMEIAYAMMLEEMAAELRAKAKLSPVPLNQDEDEAEPEPLNPPRPPKGRASSSVGK